MKKIVFEAGELADAYCLRTLYDALRERNFEERKDVKIYFRVSALNPFSSILKDGPIDESSCELGTSLYVQTYCDFKYKEHDSKNLSIDIAVLKNCALPMSCEEKEKVREILGIETERPVVVISYSKCNLDLVYSFVNSTQEFSEIYLIDGHHYNLPKSKNIHVVNLWGIMKAYYAVADVSVNAKNLVKNDYFLHNFVEATEGGPLFMVPPEEKYQRQYGYKELSELEVIKNCESPEDLTAKVSKYLQRPIEQIREENEAHCGKRAEHILQTREKYLPIIESEIERMLAGEHSSSRELIVKNEGNGRILQHPDSWWK
jgi:hypothetical protein